MATAERVTGRPRQGSTRRRPTCQIMRRWPTRRPRISTAASPSAWPGPPCPATRPRSRPTTAGPSPCMPRCSDCPSRRGKYPTHSRTSPPPPGCRISPSSPVSAVMGMTRSPRWQRCGAPAPVVPTRPRRHGSSHRSGAPSIRVSRLRPPVSRRRPSRWRWMPTSHSSRSSVRSASGTRDSLPTSKRPSGSFAPVPATARHHSPKSRPR